MSTVAAAREHSGELTAQRDAPVGGQAVMEGVMMRGVSNWAVGVRKPPAPETPDGPVPAEGEIEVKTFPLDSAMRRHRVLRLPIIRGVVALGGSLAIGFRALEISANAQLVEEPSGAPAEAPSPNGEGASANGACANGASPNGATANGASADGPAEVVHVERGTKEEEEIPRAVWLGTIVVALVLAIVLFFVVPVGITSLFKNQLGSPVLFWLVEGCIRTGLFLGYMYMLSRVKDLRR
ncbi:MAG TPA: DUF1385 domain-containing protein, partial [Solirubrobacteraceae bacterium]|nr:DUF1385 domain-containing protein [Solirubrobacteraceae bacterium]